MEDAANDNIAYIELRTGPKVLLKDHSSTEVEHCTKKEYAETIIGIMKEFESTDHQRYKQQLKNNNGGNEYIRLPLIPRLIISVDRSGTLDQAMENIQLAIEMSKSSQSKRYIVGVELGGNPMRNDFRDFQPAFELARKEGLPIAIHCGEVPCENELEKDETKLKAYHEAESILQFKPDRLGHALLLSDSLMEKLFQQPIPIECCPTSNIMTLMINKEGNLLDGMKLHPQLGKWLEKKYPISINTDDSGLFCTNLTKELLLVAKAHHLGDVELSDIVLGSVEHIFDQEIQSTLRTNIQTKIAQITST